MPGTTPARNRAGTETPVTVRAKLALGDLARQTADHKAAIGVYQEVMDAEPRLIGEVIPRLAESCRAIEDQELLSGALNKLRQKEYEYFDAAGRRVAVIDANGVLSQYGYDASGRLTRSIRYANPVDPGLSPRTLTAAQLGVGADLAGVLSGPAASDQNQKATVIFPALQIPKNGTLFSRAY